MWGAKTHVQQQTNSRDTKEQKEEKKNNSAAKRSSCRIDWMLQVQSKQAAWWLPYFTSASCSRRWPP